MSSFRPPQPATDPLYLVFDIRDCYKDEATAKAAAQAMDGAQEGYIFCLKFESVAQQPFALLGDIPTLDD